MWILSVLDQAAPTSLQSQKIRFNITENGPRKIWMLGPSAYRPPKQEECMKPFDASKASQRQNGRSIDPHRTTVNAVFEAKVRKDIDATEYVWKRKELSPRPVHIASTIEGSVWDSRARLGVSSELRDLACFMSWKCLENYTFNPTNAMVYLKTCRL